MLPPISFGAPVVLKTPPSVQLSSCAPNSKLRCSFFWPNKKLFRLLLRSGVSRVVCGAEVFQSQRPDRGHLRHVLAGFRPVEMGRVARKYDYGAGWIGLELARVEFVTQPYIKDAGN